MMTKTAIAHAWSGDRHGVAAVLRVLVSHSDAGDYYVARGIDIDYVATAKTQDEVRNSFAEGFLRTVYSMLSRGRDLTSLFTKSRAPAEVMAAYEAAEAKELMPCIASIDLSDRLPARAEVPHKVVFHSAEDDSKTA